MSLLLPMFDGERKDLVVVSHHLVEPSSSASRW